MSDILDRLYSGNPGVDSTYPKIMAEAADTIAALTARVAELEGAVNKSRSRIASLISDNEGLRRETQEYARQIIDLEEEVKQLKTGLEG